MLAPTTLSSFSSVLVSLVALAAVSPSAYARCLDVAIEITEERRSASTTDGTRARRTATTAPSARRPTGSVTEAVTIEAVSECDETEDDENSASSQVEFFEVYYSEDSDNGLPLTVEFRQTAGTQEFCQHYAWITPSSNPTFTPVFVDWYYISTMETCYPAGFATFDESHFDGPGTYQIRSQHALCEGFTEIIELDDPFFITIEIP